MQLLEQLKSLPADGNVKVPGVTGTVAARIDTPSGAIVIGGKGNNTYQLDQMRDVAVVIDLGGGNTYYEGTVGPERPVLIVINLEGNNTFRGSKPGIQGGAVLGVSMLLNLGGNNTYEALDVAQGSALAGVGILIDYGSNNRYRGVRRVQGQALGGLGILIGRGGKNDYHAAMWAQGFGGPLGFGLLDNVTGNNHYYCGGMWRDSLSRNPRLRRLGPGRRRRHSAGGQRRHRRDPRRRRRERLRVRLPLARRRLLVRAGLRPRFRRQHQAPDHPHRLQRRPAHPAQLPAVRLRLGLPLRDGLLFDDSGDDVYEGTIMGTGMAWDCSMGVLCDFAGNDHYKATGGLTQGTGAQMGFGILFDYDGDDVYEGYGQGYASPSISYHTLPDCGGNFSFLVDYGGKDTYGCGAENNSYIQRGDQGGFLIDRPRRDEAEPTATATPHATAGS